MIWGRLHTEIAQITNNLLFVDYQDINIISFNINYIISFYYLKHYLKTQESTFSYNENGLWYKSCIFAKP